jgi:alpha-ketoglutarate-dependent taurine dioxygenase
MSGPIEGARRQQVASASEAWLRPEDEGHVPLEVRATTDVDLAAWAGDHAHVIDGWLHLRGAVLFSGFGIGLADMGAVADALLGSKLPYRERSSPRTELSPGIYTSTDYPADQPISLHNENAYQSAFPARLAFCCIEPPDHEGATLLADCRRVLDRIPSGVVSAFRDKGVRYVRTFRQELGLSWREAFQVQTRDEVSQYCSSHGITAQWLGEDDLRTEQVRPALAMHPVTREEVWFNHAAFFHASSLPGALRDALVAQYGHDGLPVEVTYGDGTPIASHDLGHVRAAHDAETHAHRWRRGDLLLVDNLLAAHGRAPYSGTRRVVVSMGGLISHGECT